jgi:hypothetical protein
MCHASWLRPRRTSQAKNTAVTASTTQSYASGRIASRASRYPARDAGPVVIASFAGVGTPHANVDVPTRRLSTLVAPALPLDVRQTPRQFASLLQGKSDRPQAAQAGGHHVGRRRAFACHTRSAGGLEPDRLDLRELSARLAVVGTDQAPGQCPRVAGEGGSSNPHIPHADYEVRSRTCRTVAAYHSLPPWAVGT